jgi:hypothetical protein
MAVPTLTYGYEIRKQQKNRKQKLKLQKRNSWVQQATQGRQVKHPKIREELNVFNLNTKIIKSRSRWKYNVQRMEGMRILEKF